MTSNFWFGVAGSKSLSKTDTTKTWWCLPYAAKEGDRVLLYCPRSISAARHGVFAEASVLVPPMQKRQENCYCSTYGYGKTGLGYAEIEIIERFKPKLTAKHMKLDSVLMFAGLVRKNSKGRHSCLSLKFTGE